MKFKKNNVQSTIGIIFTILGLTILLAGMVIAANQLAFNAKMPETQAVITDITGHNDSHTVWVEYTVDGDLYNTTLNYYSSTMHIGDRITIHYDPSNPYVFQRDSILVNLIVLPFGVIFGGVGIFFLILNSKSKKQKKFLLENGNAMYATVTNIIMDRSTKVNNRHPYMIECEIFDQYTGERFVYTSESCFNDLHSFIGASVPVYVDPSDPQKAFVDIEALVEDSIM